MANYSGNNLTKLKASDGSLVATIPAGGTGPVDVVWDGSSIWVANWDTNTVTKLAADGSLLLTIPGGTVPNGLAYDGANVWVANFYSDTATKIRASDGVVLGNYPVGVNPNGVIFDGANIWVANQNSDSVTKLRASDGALLGQLSRRQCARFRRIRRRSRVDL